MPTGHTKKEKPLPTVTLSLSSGLVTPYQQRCWSLFWANLIAEVKKKQGDNNHSLK
jgi:hypothetical protein